MKIAEAMNRIKQLRKEFNEADITPFIEGTEIIIPDRMSVQIDRKAGLLGEIARIKSNIAKTNVNTQISYNMKSMTLSQALNLLDSMREEKAMYENSVLRNIKGSVPSRTIRQGSEYVEKSMVANFSADDAFIFKQRAAQLDTDISALASLINYTNWNTDVLT